MLQALGAQDPHVFPALPALSASVGIAIFPEDGEDGETLISKADAAMYRSKKAGPGKFLLYGDAHDGQLSGGAPITG